jgi:hypothetical protein
MEAGTRGVKSWGTQRLSVTNTRRDDAVSSSSQPITAWITANPSSRNQSGIKGRTTSHDSAQGSRLKEHR